MVASAELESVEAFRARLRAWLPNNLTRRTPGDHAEMSLAEAKIVQARIFDDGFAGIAMPKEYGGAGLTLDHQQVYAEEVADYMVPEPLYVSIGMLGPTLLDHGSEELKRTHLPRILRGEANWVQLLSEPSGGSDMAGATTRATKDGDTWVIRGAKMWTTGAGHSQYGMCLARTDWDAPKHRGLSMFAVPFDAPGVTIEPIRSILGGPAHFFQEFFDDVVIPEANLIGTLNDGWTVAHSLLHHERQATAGIGHGLGLGGGGGHKAEETGNGVEDLIAAAQLSGTRQDSSVRQLIAEAYVTSLVAGLAGERVMAGLKSGALRGDWGSLLKLGLGIDVPRRGEIGVMISAGDGVMWSADDADGEATSLAWLDSRSIAIAGGTNEMQRNIVSERLLGLPREPGSDKDVPFRELMTRRSK